MTFSYLSVCSGLEGASLAFEPLGARAVGFAEIEAFPSAIIAHRYGSNLPGEPPSHNAPPNFGDFTRIHLDTLGQVDVLIGGTPCQAFSVAGKRLSLDDARGNLTLAYAVLAHELARSHGLRNAIWENVPGVLNTGDNAFGCFLGAIVGADNALRTPDGGSWPDAGMVAGPRARAAWRVLDAQYFGLSQRRRRVFLVADFGNGADPAAVLFEPKGLRGDSPPRREKGEGIAPTIAARTRGGGGLGTDFDCDGGLIAAQPIPLKEPRSKGDAGALRNSECGYPGDPMFTLGCGDVHGVAHALRGEGFDASEDGTVRGTQIVPICFDETQITSTANRSNPQPGDPSHALAKGARPPMIAFDARQSDVCIYGECAAPLDTDGYSQAIALSCKDHVADATNDLAPTMRAMPHSDSHPNAGGQLAVAQQTYSIMPQNSGKDYKARAVDVAQPLMAVGPTGGNQGGDYVATQWAVRRLTPEECEKLQGVPVGYTRIPWRGKPAEQCPDGPRYKALGNSWAVPVVRWIGERLAREMKLAEFDAVFGPPEAWK